MGGSFFAGLFASFRCDKRREEIEGERRLLGVDSSENQQIGDVEEEEADLSGSVKFSDVKRIEKEEFFEEILRIVIPPGMVEIFEMKDVHKDIDNSQDFLEYLKARFGGDLIEDKRAYVCKILRENREILKEKIINFIEQFKSEDLEDLEDEIHYRMRLLVVFFWKGSYAKYFHVMEIDEEEKIQNSFEEEGELEEQLSQISQSQLWEKILDIKCSILENPPKEFFYS